jgi:hypothetical protein
LIVIIGIP